MTSTAFDPVLRRQSALDIARLTARALRRETRSIDALVVTLALPVLIMVVFVYVLGGAIDTGASGLDYIDFVVPSVLLLAAGYGAALTAPAVCADTSGEVFDRFRSLPIDDSALPISHVLASAIRNTVSTLLALAAAVALGFRPTATLVEWLAALGLVIVYIVAVSAVGALWGLIVTSPEAAGAFGFVVLFAPYLSDGFVPAETMPPAIRSVAEHQPLTSIIDTLRALLVDEPVGNSGWTAAAWLTATTLLATIAAARRFRHRATT